MNIDIYLPSSGWLSGSVLLAPLLLTKLPLYNRVFKARLGSLEEAIIASDVAGTKRPEDIHQ